MKRFWNMLVNGEYSAVRTEVKKLLEEQNDNYELWYLLFLSSNHNYLNFNSYNASGEMFLNKAREFATVKEEALINSEYQLYSNISDLKGFDFIFRFYQFGKYDESLNKLNEVLDDTKVHLNVSKICDSLDLIFAKTDSLTAINMQVLIINALYIKTDAVQFLDMFNEKIKNPLYSTSSVLGIDQLCPSSYELKKHMTEAKVFNNKKEVMEEEIKALKKDLDEKEKNINEKNTTANQQTFKNYPYNEFKNTNSNSRQSNVIYDSSRSNNSSNYKNNYNYNTSNTVKAEDATLYLVLGLLFSVFCTPIIGMIMFNIGYKKRGTCSSACGFLFWLCLISLIIIGLSILWVFFQLSVA
ncbi:MAG: hypothetical protein K6E20_06550 [Acholeplasmatales bacterium]|nr:hypothetical protein [Acholeplasmatales bacterium]